MSKLSSSDDWGTASTAYAARAEYVTRPSAEELISWVHKESSLSAPGAIAFDNGAGSGVVTTVRIFGVLISSLKPYLEYQDISWVYVLPRRVSRLAIPPRTSKTDSEIIQTLRTRFPNIPILAADLSPGMLEKIEKKGLPQVKCQALDAVDLSPIVDSTFTHTLSTFMIQFTPDPLRALKEMYRVTKSGGTLGLCMWGEMCFDAPWEETVRRFEPDYTCPHTW